ncbi:MAG: GNAT family N-acetyltransferase [Steroidobacteraceae bacterium]
MNTAPPVVRVLRKRDELDETAAAWDALPQARANPLLGSRWFAAAARLHPDDALYVVTIETGTRLVAVAPLTQSRRNLVNRLEFIGARTLNEPSGLLAESPSHLMQLCDELTGLRRPLLLQRIPVDSNVESRLRQCARGKGRLFIARSAPCHRVDITGNWADYLATRSSQVRSGMRRKRAILGKTGTVSVDTRRPQPGELPSVFDEALDIEADGWKGSGHSSMRSNDALRGFVVELARRFAETGELQISFLRAGQRAVAMCLLLEFDRRLWEIKIGYRDSARRASPGRLLLWETLRGAFEKGLRSYEFLGSGDSQQPDWATSSQELHTLVYYPYSFAGIVALVMDVMSHLLRRLRT